MLRDAPPTFGVPQEPPRGPKNEGHHGHQVPRTAVVNMSGVSGGMSVSIVSAVQPTLSANTARRSVVAGQPSHQACAMGERQFDVPCRSPNHWDSHIESIYELEGEIWNGGAGMNSMQTAVLWFTQ